MVIIPALIKIFIIFAVILSLNRLRLNLGISLLIGALILGSWMGMDFMAILKSILTSLTRLQTLSLALIVWLIMVLSGLMEKGGNMDRLVKSFSSLSKDGRTVGAVMAALIGLLPMPGGALFSAPMVEASISDVSITGEQKTAVNYWFRHIWEFWWPLYPGVILAIALLEVTALYFMAMMISVTLISILAGILFILRPMGKLEIHEKAEFSWLGIRYFIQELIPILIVVFFIFAITIAVNLLGRFGVDFRIDSGLAVLPGLIIAIAWVCRYNNISAKEIKTAVLKKNAWSMVFLILSIMAFKNVMSDSQAVLQIRNDMVTYGIPLILVIMLMPFLSGLIMGIAVGFVGVSFPLIIPMFQTPDLLNYLSTAGLAYTFGYMGMLLSPVHLCFLVSKDYYNASLLNTYPHIIRPAIAVMSISVLCYSFLKLF
ncbi:MAG: DUF401 family protein [Deltaproteobacteria bacterium]|nr:DUF401 family protein [Deltaproteobacteria bacterium]